MDHKKILQKKEQFIIESIFAHLKKVDRVSSRAYCRP